ncbi:flagellar protein FlaG [Tepidibacter formicigenes]|jgi:flagellar protein FlaG|uniref:Flagellar protein FlaG n=1 Tax=Tepidibacter formicigenes DSM 15518 TaxID=1123349 RepID=A0A1M6NZF0_9FIRM|nr:flagellar protein FlaG [Tepidibacter formicigenes]SHK01041.1 flagellar protein FlaG [Tepidibacter formicigenes DSM 15518]
MRVDSSMFNNQIVGAKSEIVNDKNKSENKEDVVKQSQKKEENVSFPGEKKLIEAIEKSNKELLGTNSHLKFSIHEKTKEIVVKIVDNETKKVIKEIPSEKILDMVADMCERAGIFVDKRG